MVGGFEKNTFAAMINKLKYNRWKKERMTLNGSGAVRGLAREEDLGTERREQAFAPRRRLPENGKGEED